MDNWSSVSDSLPPILGFDPGHISPERARNSKRPINKLPAELLFRIFAIGDEERRRKRLRNVPYYGFQDTIVRVCSYWRDVAINSPDLWSYIYISKAPPRRYTLVYLARSGATAPLDIDIYLPIEDPEGLIGSGQNPPSGVDETINFLVSHGATTNRWRSFILHFNVASIPFPSTSYINVELPRSLRFLSIKSWANVNYRIRLRRLHDLLSSNPQLRSLDLSVSAFQVKPTSRRVHLPALHSFSLDYGNDSSRAQDIIKMIDAPAVERLQLAGRFDREIIFMLVDQLTIGASEEKSAYIRACISRGEPIPYKSIYPLLWDLSIETTFSISAEITYLFGIFSTVTRIFLPGWAVGFLNSTPLVLPNLKCISTGKCYRLEEVVRSRIEAGFPVNRVEMGVGSLKTKGKWPDSVEVVEGPVPSYVSGRHDDYDDYPRNDDSDRGRYDRDGCIYVDSR